MRIKNRKRPITQPKFRGVRAKGRRTNAPKAPRSKLESIKRTLLAWLTVSFILLLLGVYAFNITIKPIIESYAINQAKNRVTKIVNESVLEEIKENAVSYGDLVDIAYSDTGLVTSVKTKIPELNTLRSSITSRIIDHLVEFREQTVRLPLGTVLGGPIFSGKGPYINIKLLPSNFIETRIENDFSAAGINQTKHRINLIISMTITTVMPGHRFSSKVDTNVVLSETVIVGAVPDAFTEVKDPTSDIVGIVEDYAAG